MNFIIECMKIVLIIMYMGFFSMLAHIVLTLWQHFPIEEERSTPIYITKEIKDGR